MSYKQTITLDLTLEQASRKKPFDDDDDVHASSSFVGLNQQPGQPMVVHQAPNIVIPSINVLPCILQCTSLILSRCPFCSNLRSKRTSPG